MNLVSNKIKELLKRNGGTAYCNMLKGSPLSIWLTEGGVANSGFQGFICEWEIFDGIVEKARELGGKMYKGDVAAQNGAKIGSDELPLDTIDAYISLKYYGNKIGNSTLRRSTYYAAILAWAGICTNHRSDGKGGYIVLKESMATNEKNKIFTVDNDEYIIIKNPHTKGPMISRTDGLDIPNRKEICRRFLRMHGWTDDMFVGHITNDLERHISYILNGKGEMPKTTTQKEYHRSSYVTIKESPKVEMSSLVDRFLYYYNNDSNGRYYSYDHIRSAFLQYREDETKRDLLTLHLFTYLSSWGMLRNSFLMQKDYLFNRPVIDILCKPEYDSLLDYNPFNSEEDGSTSLILKLCGGIQDYYNGKTFYEENNLSPKLTHATDTLVSKIILGTFGCMVAYDTYVKNGLSKLGLSRGICKKSILELKAFAQNNKDEIDESLSKLNNLYTPMKVIDMFLFEKGRE